MNKKMTETIDYMRTLEADRMTSLLKWTETLKADPAYAFKWSEDAFRDAAEHEVFGCIIRELEKHDPECSKGAINVLDRYASSAVKNMISTSSSVPANEISRWRMIAWQEIWVGSGYASVRNLVEKAVSQPG